MNKFVKNLGGKNALLLRISFLLIAVALVFTPLYIGMSKNTPVSAPTLDQTEKPKTTAPITKPITEPSTEEPKYVVLSAETIQNDLRLKFYDKGMKLFTNYEFEVSVTYPDGKVKLYTDNDKDGKINLTNIPAGKYLVQLTVPEGFETAKADISITVKDKIVYKPIENVKDDTVDESKVEEVKPEQKQIVEENILKDTVEFVKSSEKEIVTYDLVVFENIINPEPETGEPESTEAGPSAGTTEPETTNPAEPETSTQAADLEKKRLTDKDGNKLFIKSGEEYIEAFEYDYGPEKEFYKKTVTIRYTGWQIIDGSTYYYDKNGNPVIGEQVINGAKYNFTKAGALQKGSGVLGIDVSKFQGTIDWKQVAASGVKFAIIRVAGRGYGTAGSLYIDSRFEENLRGAKAAGIDVGVYFFSQAINEVEAVEEASLCIETLNGASLKYPVFIDIEYATTQHTGRADSLSKASRTAIAKAFCETIKSAGYKAGVYANKDFFTNKLDASALSKYYIWLAQYNDKVTYKGPYDMWQYSSKGTVAGISGNVDMDFSYIF